jgi:3-oxoacyl-[acyl-carrier protein] reductase
MSGSRKTAVIVGATGNLGSAIGEVLKSRGYDLDPIWLSAERPDATKAASYAKLPAKIHAAIYVAGINIVAPVETLTEEQWDKVMDVNLKGAFLFAKGALPGLKAAAPSTFVTISSIMVSHPYPNRAAYASAKAGIEGLTKVLAVEWGQYGIASHSIRLGHLEGLMKSTPPNPKLLSAVKERTPLKKLIQPKQVADYVGWLVDGGSSAVSGSVLTFDPAYTINRWPLE